MTPEKYPPSDQVKRVCDVIRVLSGHTVQGMAPGELAKAVRTSPSNITRLLAQLKHEGFVEETRREGFWRLGPRAVQCFAAHSADITRHETEINEVKQRYSCAI